MEPGAALAVVEPKEAAKRGGRKRPRREAMKRGGG
jgi:hypothetical protein